MSSMFDTREMHRADGEKWRELATDFVKELKLDPSVEVELDVKAKVFKFKWSSPLTISDVMDKVSSQTCSSPNYMDEDGGALIAAWHWVAATFTRSRPSISLGYGALCVALAGECGVCLPYSNDEASFMAYDTSRSRADGHLLEAHPQLLEFSKIVGRDKVQNAAELLGTLIPDESLESVRSTLCTYGHLSGIFESANAL